MKQPIAKLLLRDTHSKSKGLVMSMDLMQKDRDKSDPSVNQTVQDVTTSVVPLTSCAMTKQFEMEGKRDADPSWSTCHIIAVPSLSHICH